jgi:hypothetical protein
MASVDAPDITYELQLPEKIMEKVLLSRPQLETVVYACQCHDTYLGNGQRRGFFLGDGAGVGKGRQLAGIILENWIQGRQKHIWMSASTDLQLDAQRDLKDIGACDIDCFLINKIPLDSRKDISIKKGVIFLTYSSLVATTGGKSRLEQLIRWCGPNFDGCILFDEAHRAKNLVATGKGKSTKAGLSVAQIQESLPLARIVYSSATGASEPNNMVRMFTCLHIIRINKSITLLGLHESIRIMGRIRYSFSSRFRCL